VNATGRPSPRRTVVWAARALGILLSTLVGAGAAEILLRVQSTSAHPGAKRQDPEADGLPEIEGVFPLGASNQRARYRGALYTTNSRGFRGREFALEAPRGTFRIVMIGDSFTMGSGVREEEAYPALVEAALLGTGEKRNYEVLNLGLSGLNLASSIDSRLVRIGLDYDPDMIVYGFTINDLEGRDYVAHPRQSRKPTGSLLLDLLWERWAYGRDLVWPSKSSYVRELDHNYFRNPSAWGRFESDLDRLVAIGRERGTCIVVLIHTQLTALHSWHPFRRHYEAVANAARRRNIFVVESFPWFEGIDPAGYTSGPHDSHPNAVGHQILAEALLRALRALPAQCWEGGRQVSQ
jgi:lysophospholipase L1-like esterase